jgi:hypothetical protein
MGSVIYLEKYVVIYKHPRLILPTVFINYKYKSVSENSIGGDCSLYNVVLHDL